MPVLKLLIYNQVAQRQHKIKGEKIRTVIKEAHINKISKELSLITLFPPIKGFNNFIGTWVYQQEKTFIVDVGPAVTAKSLIKALKHMGIQKLDYILLTHIHIDHAGGLCEVAEQFPDALIVCHDGGIEHLVDPARLWKGSVKTLGKTGIAYGEIKPVSQDRFLGAKQFLSETINVVITPGHAPYHISYQTEKYLFPGEAGGICLSPDSKTDLKKEYMRPATPPRFFMDVYIESLEKLITLNPKTICYSHFGYKTDAVKRLKQHKEQLFFWEKTIQQEVEKVGNENIVENCIQNLLKHDPLMAMFSEMTQDMQNREYEFLKNSVNGFLGYLKTTADNC
jgi:glyoxylase-like metal-dependent hydrolase (beta-lactamase superfamily II)